MQLHTAHRYFKGGTLGVGAVLGLLSEKKDIETTFDKFREKLKGYVEININNMKDVMYVVTDMEDKINTFEEYNIPKYLIKEEVKSTLKQKIL